MGEYMDGMGTFPTARVPDVCAQKKLHVVFCVSVVLAGVGYVLSLTWSPASQTISLSIIGCLF
jgi:hypothetical protein